MIPHEIHFTYTTLPDTDGKPFSLLHYLSIKAAATVNQCPVYFHYELKPEGPWWDKALRFMIPVCAPVPREIAGIPLQHPAHRSDIMRLQILRARGGIYIDLDVICSTPFSTLLDNRCVLGAEPGETLCNGVILAEPGSEFIICWLEGYDPKTSLTQGFRSTGMDEHWSEMSAGYSAMLSRRYPDLVTVLPPHAFHFPGFDREVVQMFMLDTPPPPKAWCYHLFQSRNWLRLSQLSIATIRNGGTNLCRLLQPLVADE